MSEFFNVTLDKNVALDDSSISSSLGWSSKKILDQIIAYRVNKFEELSDVNVVNRKNGQVVAYSEDMNKFITIDLETLGDTAGMTMKQLTKLGVVATPSSPHTVNIDINTLDFKFPKVNVLKFIQGEQNIISNKATFVNNESNDFEVNDNIVFDGTAHLKTNFSCDLTLDDVNIDGYYSYNGSIDKSMYKSIDSIGLSDSKINIIANPNDLMLMPKGDINLSNVANVDYFNLKATGNNIRIICSADSGETWKTFNVDHWENINPTIDEVSINGIDLNTFNNMNSLFWNLLITAKKIRFAYLLSGNNAIDELKIQYDAPGYWIEVKEADFDVAYASNNLLQVKLYFSGDVKINY